MLNYDAEKTARFDTVDHPMIKSERQGHYFPDNDLSVACDGAIFDLAQSQYGHFGIIDDRGTVGGADDPVVGNCKRAASQLWEINLSMPRFFGEGRTLSRQVQNIFLVGLLDDEDDKTVAGVDGDTDVVIPLENNLSRCLVK